MAMPNLFGKLPPRTVTSLLIGSCALLLFVLLGIIPKQKSLHELDNRIDQGALRILEQGMLQPVYQNMLTIAKANGAKAPKTPDKQPLNQKGVSEVTDMLAQVVVRSGLEAQSVTPDPTSLGKGSRSLSVRLVVRGPLEKCRTFLGELAMLPSFENIQNVRLGPGAGPREMAVTVWLAAE